MTDELQNKPEKSIPAGFWRDIIGKDGTNPMPPLTDQELIQLSAQVGLSELPIRITAETHPKLYNAGKKAADKSNLPELNIYVVDSMQTAYIMHGIGAIFLGKEFVSTATDNLLESMILHEIGHGFQQKYQKTANIIAHAMHKPHNAQDVSYPTFIISSVLTVPQIPQILNQHAILGMGKIPEITQAIPEIMPTIAAISGGVFFTTTALCTMGAVIYRAIIHNSELDADAHTVKNADNPQEYIDDMKKYADFIDDPITVKDFLKTPPILHLKISQDSHPKIQKRVEWMQQILDQRTADEKSNTEKSK